VVNVADVFRRIAIDYQAMGLKGQARQELLDTDATDRIPVIKNVLTKNGGADESDRRSAARGLSHANRSICADDSPDARARQTSV
jgi:hypothetical protein